MTAAMTDTQADRASIGLRDRVGCVIIGRNEGERLRQALLSAQAGLDRVVYVDSGSTDGSPALARDMGAKVVVLDPSRPYTAARGRNEGFRAMKDSWPDLAYVQFVDGDCTLAEGWLGAAADFLDRHPEAAIVCGRRREIAPERSIYNALCDMEWDGPVGEIGECGGDVLARCDALDAVSGYDPSLIAGEEPELCIRLRSQRWTIWRIGAEMTRHDANMARFSQFWRRARRAGHAFAEVSDMHRGDEHVGWSRNVTSCLLWGGALPLGIVISSLASPLCVVLVGIYPLQVLRIARRSAGKARPWAYALLTMAGKVPEAIGVVEYHLGKLGGRRRTLIEYK